MGSKFPIEVMQAAIGAACVKAPDYDAHVLAIAGVIMEDRNRCSQRDAAITFRCPEGFEALSEALGMNDTPEDRARLDSALKKLASRPEIKASVANRNEIARIIDPINFNMTPASYGTDDEGFKRTFAYGSQLLALSKADAVIAALSPSPQSREVGTPVDSSPVDNGESGD